MLRPAFILVAAVLAATPVAAQSRLTLGQTVQGQLSSSDDRHQDGSFVDCYVLEAPAGQRLEINMTSLAFDSYLAVGEGTCAQLTAIERDDDSGGGLNARITRVSTGRRLIILANSVSAGATGAYALRAASTGEVASAGAVPAARANPPATRLNVGQTVNGTLASSDSLLSDDSFYDCFSVQTRVGQRLQIDQTSSDFDSYLSVGTGSCEQLAASTGDDDSGGGLNARVLRDGDGSVLFIQANSIGARATGAYQLRVSPAQGPGGNASSGPGNSGTGVTPATAPFYWLKQDSETILLASAGSVRRTGDLATLTTVTGASREYTDQNAGVGLLTTHYEIDCSGNRLRPVRAVAYNEQGGLILEMDTGGNWSAVDPGAPSAVIRRIACNGERPASLEVPGTPLSISTAYREGRLPPRR
jgi:hypothetical protein